jgi:hypothetical protein
MLDAETSKNYQYTPSLKNNFQKQRKKHQNQLKKTLEQTAPNSNYKIPKFIKLVPDPN